MAGSRASRAWCGSRSGVPSARLLIRRIGRGLGGASRRRGCFRPLVSRRVGHFNQRQGALGHQESSSLFCSTDKELVRSNFCGQLYSDCLSSESGGTRSLLLNSIAQRILRWSETLPVQLTPQFIMGRHNVLADSLSRPNQVLGSEWTLEDRGVSKAPEEVASVHRPVCHLTQSPMFSIFFTVP